MPQPSSSLVYFTMHFLLRLALLLCAVAPAWPAAAPRVPNLIYIVSDDQGFDLACFGSKQFVTPHLDRMAAEGVRAKRCCNSRAER